MGLQKNITLDNGINLPEAYMKISSCTYINGYHTVINVNVYKDKTSRVNNKPEIIKFKHSCVEISDFNQYFSLDVLNELDKNIISQSYLWLKTLSFYSDAIDVNDLKE